MTGKQEFRHRADARSALLAVQARRRKQRQGGSVETSVYRCPHCLSWHLIHWLKQ